MLFKYVGASDGAEALKFLRFFCEQHTLKASCPATFNDPFEFKIDVDFDAEEEIVRQRFFVDRPNASLAEYTHWRRQFTEQPRWSLIQETRARLISQFGVFCLSAIGDNHLMYSHYSSDHKGFCVALDEKQLEGLDGVIGHGFVSYQDDAPTFKYYFESLDTFQQRAFGCKSSLWAYEKEYRLIFDRSGEFGFPSKALQQVLLGCRAYPELRVYAHEHVGTCDWDFFQMCEDFGSYRLTKRPLDKNTTLMSSFF